MAGKYSVIVTIIKSISIYFTTSCCKKNGLFFNAFQPISVPEECLLDHLYSFFRVWFFGSFFGGFFGGKKPTLNLN